MSNNNSPGTKWLTKKDAMQYLSLSKRGIENHTSSGVLRYYKLKGRVYFDRDELDEDIRGNKK